MTGFKERPRILGLDLGTKTIGLALSDPTGSMSMPLGVVRRKGMAHDLAELKRVIEERQVAEIVLGLPLRLNEAESAGSQRSRDFAERLAAEFGLPVHLIDESFSTMAAEDILIEAKVSRKKRKKVIDGLAAAVILQSHLNERREGEGKS